MPGHPEWMVAETTDLGSVFDVGALFSIPGQDRVRALFRHVVFCRLAEPATWERVAESIARDPELDSGFRDRILSGPLDEFRRAGARTHHVGMLDAETGELVRGKVPENPSSCNVVRRFPVLRPSPAEVFGSTLFDYSACRGGSASVVPLEFIVRFGLTRASSVYRRYLDLAPGERSAFASELGLTEPLIPWASLPRPVADFTTKFEPADRMLTRQEALHISALDGPRFDRAIRFVLLGSWAVRSILDDLGLRLWDLKWELARDGDDLVFVDTIDPDSFRATLRAAWGDRAFACHFNKQAVRDYFQLMHPAWVAAIRDAKARARDGGRPFTSLLEEGQEKGAYPATPIVEEAFVRLQADKMRILGDHLRGRTDASRVRDDWNNLALEELAFYENAGKLEEHFSLNGIT